jgi:hypothetical protein
VKAVTDRVTGLPSGASRSLDPEKAV